MIDESRVVERFMNYVRIGSETHFEGEMGRYLAQELRDLGFEVYVDRAGETVESDGNNVYCFLPGDESFERLMFSSHMDTVTPGNHVEPVIRDGYIVAAGDTILGADDKAGIAAIVEAIVNELDDDRNQALSTLAPLKKALGEEAYNELLASNAAYYDTVTTKVQEGEARINEIVAQARAEERTLTQAEADEITRIRDEMQNTGIQHLSKTEIEYQTIMNRLKDNATRVSLEQASEIIKNAQTTRDETIAAAQTQYATVELEAQRMLGVGAINQEQYDAILLAAQTTRDESILAAQEQYQTIYDTTTEKLGDTAKYIDSETGAIKSKWDVFCDNVAQKWTQKWTDIKTGWTEWKSDFMTSWEECKTTFKTGWDTLWDNVAQKWTDWKANFMRGWEDFKTEFKQGWASFWTGIGNFFIGLWNGLVTAVEDACNIIIDMVNYVIAKMGAILAFLGISIPQVSHIKLDRVEYLEVPAFEDGGFPDMGQFFLAVRAEPKWWARSVEEPLWRTTTRSSAASPMASGKATETSSPPCSPSATGWFGALRRMAVMWSSEMRPSAGPMTAISRPEAPRSAPALSLMPIKEVPYER